jgi:hypothetical protein
VVVVQHAIATEVHAFVFVTVALPSRFHTYFVPHPLTHPFHTSPSVIHPFPSSLFLIQTFSIFLLAVLHQLPTMYHPDIDVLHAFIEHAAQCRFPVPEFVSTTCCCSGLPAVFMPLWMKEFRMRNGHWT